MSRLVIGLGNPFRGDDAAGIAVTSRLRRCRVVQSLTGSFELIDAWEGYDEVVIVDATVSEAKAGEVRRFDPMCRPLPAATFASTHVIGVAETIEMARALGRLPQRMVVYGIEAGDLSEGTSMSPAVAAAVARVAEEIDNA